MRPATRMGIGGVALTALLVAAPADATAQQGRQQAGPQRPDTAELVFEREVFAYPRFERRNPFRPLVGTGDAGPRFEELSLLGVIYTDDPEASVALLATGATTGPDGSVSYGGGGETYRVREGQSLGNVRVLDIQPTRVLLEVTEFGMTEQRSLELNRPGEGGSS